MRDDVCDIKTKKYKSGNSWTDGCTKVTLGDLYAMLKSDRNIKIEVMVNFAAKPNWKWFAASFVLHPSAETAGDGSKRPAISLESCFKAFSTEELLSGDDQWYCNKCKEHRDIHKKLELYKIPKILIVQIKRF